MNGLGILKYQGIDIYEGHFINGKRNGLGKAYHKNIVRISHFINGIPDGYGIEKEFNIEREGIYKNGRF